MALALRLALNLLGRATGAGSGPVSGDGYLLAGTLADFYVRPDGSFYLRP